MHSTVKQLSYLKHYYYFKTLKALQFPPPLNTNTQTFKDLYTYCVCDPVYVTATYSLELIAARQKMCGRTDSNQTESMYLFSINQLERLRKQVRLCVQVMSS